MEAPDFEQIYGQAPAIQAGDRGRSALSARGLPVSTHVDLQIGNI